MNDKIRTKQEKKKNMGGGGVTMLEAIDSDNVNDSVNDSYSESDIDIINDST